MGEFFQQVHVWVVKHCTPWYMDGPDLIYRGTWMGHFSFKIGTWMGDGWWHFKIPRGTPLPRPKLSTPPGARPIYKSESTIFPRIEIIITGIRAHICQVSRFWRDIPILDPPKPKLLRSDFHFMKKKKKKKQ